MVVTVAHRPPSASPWIKVFGSSPLVLEATKKSDSPKAIVSPNAPSASTGQSAPLVSSLVPKNATTTSTPILTPVSKGTKEASIKSKRSLKAASTTTSSSTVKERVKIFAKHLAPTMAHNERQKLEELFDASFLASARNDDTFDKIRFERIMECLTPANLQNKTNNQPTLLNKLIGVQIAHEYGANSSPGGTAPMSFDQLSAKLALLHPSLAASSLDLKMSPVSAHSTMPTRHASQTIYSAGESSPLIHNIDRSVISTSSIAQIESLRRGPKSAPTKGMYSRIISNNERRYMSVGNLLEHKSYTIPRTKLKSSKTPSSLNRSQDKNATQVGSETPSRSLTDISPKTKKAMSYPALKSDNRRKYESAKVKEDETEQLSILVAGIKPAQDVTTITTTKTEPTTAENLTIPRLKVILPQCEPILIPYSSSIPLSTPISTPIIPSGEVNSPVSPTIYIAMPVTNDNFSSVGDADSKLSHTMMSTVSRVYQSPVSAGKFERCSVCKSGNLSALQFVQLSIAAHESNSLEASFHFLSHAIDIPSAQSQPIITFLFGIYLRHGWGCQPNLNESYRYLYNALSIAYVSMCHTLARQDDDGSSDQLSTDELAIAGLATVRRMSVIKTISSPVSTTTPVTASTDQSKPPTSPTKAPQSKAAAHAARYRLSPYPPVEQLLPITLSASRSTLALILYEISASLRFGWGVKRNKALGMRLVEVSANLGDVDASIDIGFWHIRRDRKKEGARYLRWASEFGWREYSIGWIYKEKYDE